MKDEVKAKLGAASGGSAPSRWASMSRSRHLWSTIQREELI
jgi:hypothetical protein